MNYGLIGEKLGHSFSKIIHEKIADYTYELKEISKENLDEFMTERDFNCINVTIPYKEDVMPYLDYVDSAAKAMGAVNTIVNRDGKLYGYNTDFGGMKLMIEKNGFDFCGAKVLILGSGGTAKTAKAVTESLGAREIITVSRSGEVNYDNVYTLHKDADFIINTTPCGMYPNNGTYAVDPAMFSSLKGIIDAVYNPLKTTLVQKGEKLGVKGVTGLYMLIAQAVLACGIFQDRDFDAAKLSDEVFCEIMKEKQNIVLVGMPGSGKSTIGKALAKKLGRDFIDTDDVITQKHGVISEIFSQYGESYFRDRESEAVADTAKQSSLVIATGGGAILREENVDMLRQNGVIFFLNRPLEDIIPTDDRPLSSNLKDLKKCFDERYDKYKASADFEIFVNGNIENSVIKILECIR
ncbi:MAG: AAA family ATPase [Clostridia bacterium]|nr:AAA family ATPase [Clostridia bacterium]